MKPKVKAMALEPSTYRASLWMLLALLFLTISTSCAAAQEPRESSTPSQADFALDQEAPTTGTTEIIQVDLNAIEVAPSIRAAAKQCKELQGPLHQIIQSKDPVQDAQALGLRIRENLIQVTLVLDGPDTAFLEQEGVEVGKQAGQEIQAFVPIPRLCRLAADERVLAIRPVSQAETQ